MWCLESQYSCEKGVWHLIAYMSGMGTGLQNFVCHVARGQALIHAYVASGMRPDCFTTPHTSFT